MNSCSSPVFGAIEIHFRGIPPHRKGWKFQAKRGNIHWQNPYQSEIVCIERTPLPTGAAKKQEWNVARVSFPRDELGDYRQLAIKYRLRCPVLLGLAAPLGKDAVVSKLFSTVPLSITSTLPVHLTAPFILSSDRRQIRLDGYDNSESQYNSQLLVARVPELYLFLQADLLRRFKDNRRWWPGNVKEEDRITRSAVDAFYATHVKASDQQVFSSVYNNSQLLLPRDAVIIGPGLPPLLKSKILPAFKPYQVAALSSRVSKRAIEGGQLSSVDPLFVKDMIMQNSDILESMDLKIEEVEVLLQFICHDDVTNAIGLPLLPLANGSFAVFEKYSALSKIYYVCESNSPRSNPVFRLDHLVHPKFLVKDFLDAGLNMEKLSGTAVKVLIGDILDETDERDSVGHTDQKWIATFWSQYHRLESDTTLDDISSYPLVPTTQADRYISISRCRDRTAVLFSDIFEPDSLWGWLTELGITVVPRHSATFPVALQNVLRTNDEFPSFNFGDLLALLEPASEAILVRRFSGMSAKSRQAFANWARNKVASIPSNLIPIAQRLPIWPLILARNTRMPELRAAQNIIMLPIGMPGEVARRFMNTPVAEFSSTLRHLDAKSLSLPELIQRLQLPARLSTRDVSVYKQLMEAISIGNCQPIPNFRVPNCDRYLSAINTLYGRDPLFLAAFSPGSQQFVLDEIQEYEDLLTHHGLKRQADIDLEMFKACALAIHNDTSQDRVDRALVVFHSYVEELSVRLNFSDSWAQLDAIRFIPRGRTRHTKLEGDISTFVTPFPDVVAPNEILQAQYEAIAWTQRALFGVTPNQRILVAYPTLGCPSVAEVVSIMISSF